MKKVNGVLYGDKAVVEQYNKVIEELKVRAQDGGADFNKFMEAEKRLRDLAVKTCVGGEDLKLLKTKPDAFWAGVSEIAPFAFYGFGEREIEIPESVKVVGDFAFARSSVKKVVAGGVKSVGNCAFKSSFVKGVKLGACEEFGDCCFEDCYDLLMVDGNSAKTIKFCAFNGCKQLESFDFRKVKFIDKYAFKGCGFLRVEAPCVMQVRRGAFKDCKKLKNVVLPKNAMSKEGEQRAEVFEGCSRELSVKWVSGTTGVEVIVNSEKETDRN